MKRTYYAALGIILGVVVFIWGRLAAGELPVSGEAGNLAGFIFSEYGLLGLVAVGCVLIALKSYKKDLARLERAEQNCQKMQGELASVAQREQDILKGLEEELRRLNVLLSALYAMPEDVAAKLGGERQTRVLRKE